MNNEEGSFSVMIQSVVALGYNVDDKSSLERSS